MKFIFDKRWEGATGIGRFSKEITKRVSFDRFIKNEIKPTSPLDIFVTPFYLFFNKYIYITPGFNSPFFFIKRSIITVHDLNHVDIKGNDSFLKNIYYNFILKRGCKKSLAILTVSEFSKNRIIDWAGVDESKITVVGNGVSEEYSPVGEKYSPGFDYILCVSNRKKHKNEERLVEAFAKAKKNINVKLLISGKSSANITRLAEQYGIKNDVVFSGYIEDEDLPKYYRGASAVIMPSLYEGFGLPLIEAMASGIPTASSKATSLAEVAGDSSLLFDPENIEQMSKAIVTIVSDEILREELIRKGMTRSKYYNWESVSSRVKKVINELA
ncbi:glycosyltransferase family 4 protein [Erwiniaceae bacterium CAU 1747]